jgi:hypothetical protein
LWSNSSVNFLLHFTEMCNGLLFPELFSFSLTLVLSSLINAATLSIICSSLRAQQCEHNFNILLLHSGEIFEWLNMDDSEFSGNSSGLGLSSSDEDDESDGLKRDFAVAQRSKFIVADWVCMLSSATNSMRV